MKNVFLSLVFLFSVSFMFGASFPEYDVGTKDEVKVFVQSVNNQTTLEVATVNLQTLDVTTIHPDVATVTTFKEGTGIVGIKTIHNRCEYLFYPKSDLYSYRNFDAKTNNKRFDDYPIPILKYNSKNMQPKSKYLFCTSGGLSRVINRTTIA